MSTRRSNAVVDVVPEFDFDGAIPNPYVGLIGSTYGILSRGEGSDRMVYSVVIVERRQDERIEFVDLAIAPRHAKRFRAEWVAREAIADYLRIDPAGFDLRMEVRQP